jgi:hypothetical protein
MTSDRKKPTAGFWITVALVAVLVGYPLSFGPACWAITRSIEPDDDPRISCSFYLPILWIWFEGPRPIGRFFGWYASLGAPADVGAGRDDVEGGYFIVLVPL